MLLSTSGIGGTETFILSITPYLEKLGCDVDLINIVLPNEQMRSRARSASLSFQDFSARRGPEPFSSAALLVRQIRKKQYDIIFCFGIRVSVLVRLITPLLKGIPVIIGLRNLDTWRKWYHIVPDRLLEPACALFVPNSRLVAQVRHQREKTPLHKMVTLYNGIDVSLFKRQAGLPAGREKYNIPSDKLVLTTVANFRPTKGHDFLLDVIVAFRSQLKDAHFVWVGKDVAGLQAGLMQSIHSKNLSDRITIVNDAPDVREILGMSDVFLLSSNEEGMSRALMEGLAMGLPCVSTDVGGVREIIEDSMCGYIVEFGDVQAYGGHIVRLVKDPALRQSMGAAARARIETAFSIQRIARQYLRLFELVLSGHRDGIAMQKTLDAIT